MNNELLIAGTRDWIMDPPHQLDDLLEETLNLKDSVIIKNDD